MNAVRHTDRLVQAFGALRTILAGIDDPVDRTIARDACRDALDRDAAPIATEESRIVAGTWIIEADIHCGPVFVVRAVRHRDLGTLHAMKTLRHDHRSHPVFRQLLLREGAHQLRLRHPAVVAAQAVLRLADGQPAILMDHHAAPTLATVLADGPLTAARTRCLARRLLEGLAAIHAAGLVHLDATPANILLPDGDPARALIGDFGLSLPAGSLRGADELADVGTPGFAAPEQADLTRPLDQRTDFYLIGMTLRACLGPESREDASGLAPICDRFCAPDPLDRPADAQAALGMLA